MSSPRQHHVALNRRELLHIGGLSLLGLNSLDLARLRAEAVADSPAAARRYNSCVFVFLFGGPSHIDLWDMKPDAPVEVRGQFKAASTRVPGIQICEHLPLLGAQMDKLCLLRSMTHKMNVHGPACSELFTGRPYPFPPTTDQERPEDWPSLSSLAMRYGKPRGGLPSSIVLPWYLRFAGQAKLIAGQTGGRMGKSHNAMLVDGDPSKPSFAAQGFMLPEQLTLDRLANRQALLEQLGTRAGGNLDNATAVKGFHRNHRQAFTLLQKQAGNAFDMGRESGKTREKYGDSKIGQSLLLARRLVEAGVSLVTVNWEDPTKISKTDTCWDTHKTIFPKLKNLLCPMFDRCFSAFIEDLHDRGLLETTLVVAVGEFGRTPKVGQFTQSTNTKATGRDHWPYAFTALLAGGGVRGGQIYGKTTRDGGHVKDDPVTPADLSATILHHLGIDPRQQYDDQFQLIPRHLSEGTAIKNLG